MDQILKYVFCLILALIISFISWGILFCLFYVGISFVSDGWLELTYKHYRFYIVYSTITGLLFSFKFYHEL